MAREAEHNLLLGICSRLQAERDRQDVYLAFAEDAGRVVAAALRTPPHNLVLSEVDEPNALKSVARDVRQMYQTVPGVLGPKTAAAQFSQIWERLSGQRSRLAIRERIFRADSATAPSGVAGQMDPAGEEHKDLLERWVRAFMAEALPDGVPQEDPEAFVSRKLWSQGLYLWVDMGVVSFAGCGGPTKNGIRIGPVYTPPEFRRRGYASALVACLTRQLLAEGRRFCFLFTDLANPTSNAIYQRIGYRAVTDVDQYAFE